MKIPRFHLAYKRMLRQIEAVKVRNKMACKWWVKVTRGEPHFMIKWNSFPSKCFKYEHSTLDTQPITD